MKIIQILFFALIFANNICAQQATANKQMLDLINTSWKNSDYPSILNFINSRLESNENDVLALSLKANFYIMVQKDVPKAHEAAERFLMLVNNDPSSSQALKDQAKMMAKRVTDVPLSETSAISAAGMAKLHAYLETFPFIEESFGLWGKFTKQIP